MTEAHTIVRWALALLGAALVAGCTTPPQKPPSLKPNASHPRGLDGPPGAASAGAPGTAGQGYGPASANAAEVEEEEVAADGTTRLISSSRRAAAPAHASGRQVAGDAGGASLSPSSSAASSRVGGGALPPPSPNAPPPALEGAHFDVPEDFERASGDTLNAAPASGVRGGRVDAERTGRHGVRGGRDESGATSGAPPASGQGERGTLPQVENDILAQQLREAAEQEKDPVLRDKLWSEYHKYKAGL